MSPSDGIARCRMNRALELNWTEMNFDALHFVSPLLEWRTIELVFYLHTFIFTFVYPGNGVVIVEPRSVTISGLSLERHGQWLAVAVRVIIVGG